MTLAKWITPKLYNELEGMYWRTDNFIHGKGGPLPPLPLISSLADFGVEDDVELIRVRGGALLTEILARMEAAINGTDKTKMFVYSGVGNSKFWEWKPMYSMTRPSSPFGTPSGRRRPCRGRRTQTTRLIMSWNCGGPGPATT